MARHNHIVTKAPRRVFGERTDAFDRDCLARVIAHVDSIPVADLRDSWKIVVQILWGIGFATHSRRRRGLDPQQAKVCPERVAELAWGIYYGSWFARPVRRRDLASESGR